MEVRESACVVFLLADLPLNPQPHCCCLMLLLSWLLLLLSWPISALLRDPEVAWADISNLPKAACLILDEQFSRCTSKVLQCQEAATADTTKLLIQLQDGLQVEAVVMHYDTTGAHQQPAAIVFTVSAN